MRILHVSNEQLYDASARDFDVKTKFALLHLSHGQLNNASARDYDVNVCYFKWLIIIAVEKEKTNKQQTKHFDTT